MTWNSGPGSMWVTDTDPTVNDDESNGFFVGVWFYNESAASLFQCIDSTIGNAVWVNKPTASQGSFTPSLEFGGSSTGITYTTQSGNYSRTGNLIVLNIFLNLSSKGSETGNATITGLPFINGSSHAAFLIYAQNVSLSLTYTNHGARIAPAQQFIRLFETGSLLTINNLDEGSFENDSQLFISGSYFL